MKGNSSHVKQLLVLVFCSGLCPCLISAFNITHLPGFNGALPFQLETGYVTVDEEPRKELFYYFIKSERNPRHDPLILWLTGGPGCSSFFGLVREAGPIRFKIVQYDGTLPTLIYNHHTWTKISSIIFLDWPDGTGFSFSQSFQDYCTDDLKSSKLIYKFLIQWFQKNPNFLANPFYVSGSSYGGMMVPIVAHIVAEGIEAGKQPQINLKGYVIGSPITDEKLDANSRVPFAYGMGIISHKLYESIERSCEGESYHYPTTALCNAQLKVFNGFLGNIMLDNILAPKCPEEYPRPNLTAPGAGRSLLEKKSAGLRKPPLNPGLDCSALLLQSYPSFLSYHWANNYAVREVLHVKEGSVEEWQVCNTNLIYDYSVIPSSLPYHLDLLTRGYRALVYSGDHDMIIPYLGTINWIEALNLSIIEPWRSWKVSGQVAGYTVRYSNNFTFATLKGGGHAPAKDKNKECSAMFQRWISCSPL